MRLADASDEGLLGLAVARLFWRDPSLKEALARVVRANKPELLMAAGRARSKNLWLQEHQWMLALAAKAEARQDTRLAEQLFRALMVHARAEEEAFKGILSDDQYQHVLEEHRQIADTIALMRNAMGKGTTVDLSELGLVHHFGEEEGWVGEGYFKLGAYLNSSHLK